LPHRAHRTLRIETPHAALRVLDQDLPQQFGVARIRLPALPGCRKLVEVDAQEGARELGELAVEVEGEALERCVGGATQPLALQPAHLAGPAVLERREGHQSDPKCCRVDPRSGRPGASCPRPREVA
jgi:hypothetical protein